MGWSQLAIASAITCGLMLTGCGSASDEFTPASLERPTAAEVETTTSSPAPTPTPTSPRADASARLACRHWVNVSSDFRDGLLNEDEFREKVKEVYDDAYVSETPGIADGARDLLRSVTALDPDAFGVAAEAFAGACLDSDALA